MSLPWQLRSPIIINDLAVLRVKLDITVYFDALDVSTFERLVDLYAQLFPDASKAFYKIAEKEEWLLIKEPELTASGRKASSEGISLPLLAPVRRRISSGRGFEFRLWDGKEIDEEQGWSFSSHGIRFRNLGTRSYARFLMPAETKPELVHQLALRIVHACPFSFLHAGFTFAYYPWEKDEAFDEIFRLSRRYWCVDVEDIAGTLAVESLSLKTIGWLTGVGNFWRVPISNIEGVTSEMASHGVLYRIGDAPNVGDVNRAEGIPNAYFQLAQSLAPVLCKDHPDFDGSFFGVEDNTNRWLRRFFEPTLWR